MELKSFSRKIDMSDTFITRRVKIILLSLGNNPYFNENIIKLIFLWPQTVHNSNQNDGGNNVVLTHSTYINDILNIFIIQILV